MKILTQNGQHSPEARITSALSQVGEKERGAVTSGGGKFISLPPLPSWRYRGRCDARFPPGKKSIAIRKLAPPNDDIHPFRPRHPPREFLGIPRLVTGGGDRVRFAISRPATTTTTAITITAQPTPLRIHRRHRRGPETFGDTSERKGEVYQVRTQALLVPSTVGMLEYLL